MDVRDIDDIIEFDIVDKMDVSVKIHSVELVGSSYRITLCESKYARIVPYMTNGSVFWNIVPGSFEDDGSFLVSTDDLTQVIKKGDVLELKRPYYFRGTPLAVNDEWRELTPLESEKLPMIWLSQPTEEHWEGVKSSIERVSDLVIFFLASANFRDDLTKDHRKKQVVPLLNMAHVFTDHCENDGMFGKNIKWSTRDYSRFGKETSNGIEKNIIDSELSGVRLKINLPILKNVYLCC